MLFVQFVSHKLTSSHLNQPHSKGNKIENHSWGFRFKMTLDKATSGVSATLYVDYIKFHGKTLGDQLIKKFPTLTNTKQPKSYTHEEVELFYKEYHPWITEVVNAKGPDSAFDWYHSDSNNVAPKGK